MHTDTWRHETLSNRTTADVLYKRYSDLKFHQFNMHAFHSSVILTSEALHDVLLSVGSEKQTKEDGSCETGPDRCGSGQRWEVMTSQHLNPYDLRSVVWWIESALCVRWDLHVSTVLLFSLQGRLLLRRSPRARGRLWPGRASSEWFSSLFSSAGGFRWHPEESFTCFCLSICCKVSVCSWHMTVDAGDNLCACENVFDMPHLCRKHVKLQKKM